MITNITRHGWFKARGWGSDLEKPCFEPDKEGWVLISRIIKEARRTGPGHPLATVDARWFLTMAKNNNKVRFQVREKSRGTFDAVRAVQGHSRSMQH